MSQGSIVDFKIRINPSPKLIEFISNLLDIQSAPKNILKIIEKYSSKPFDKLKIEVLEDTIKSEKLTESEVKFLSDIELQDADFENLKDVLNLTTDNTEIENSNLGNHRRQKDHENELNEELLLELNDLRWLNKILVEQRCEGICEVYLHELLNESKVILPQNEIIPRNPELEARCRKLKDEQEAREYRNMTKNVDSVRKDMPEDTVSYQIKSINRQLIAVLQFVFSVAAGFAFGFLGVELIIGNLDFGFRLLLGIMCSLTIALAEIYFLAKKLNEYDDINSEEQYKSEKKAHLD